MTDLRDPSGGQMIGSETGGWGPVGNCGGSPTRSQQPFPTCPCGPRDGKGSYSSVLHQAKVVL